MYRAFIIMMKEYWTEPFRLATGLYVINKKPSCR